MSLTQDTLGYIFSHLSLYNRRVVERVCKPWRNASVLSMYLAISLTISEINNMYINAIIARSGLCCLKKIVFNNVYIQQLVNNENLEYIDINFDINFVINLEDLEYIDINFDINFVINLEDLNNIFKRGKLRGIKIKTTQNHTIWNHQSINDSIKYIFNCKELKYFIMSTGDCINNIGLNAILTCRNLKILKLNSTKIFDDDLKDISIKCPLLEEITLLEYGLTNVGVGYIAECKKLKSIKILIRFISDGLKYLSRCVDLKHISLINCEDLCYSKFKHFNNQLTSIKLNCVLSSDGLQHIFTNFNKLKKIKLTANSSNFTLNMDIPSVEYIKLQQCNIRFNCIMNIANLRKIYITYCNVFYDEDIRCNYSIEEFRLFNIDVNDEQVKCIVGKCINLKQLYIINCRYITQHSLEFIIKKCSELKTIFIGLNILDDKFLQRCKMLKITCNRVLLGCDDKIYMVSAMC